MALTALVLTGCGKSGAAGSADSAEAGTQVNPKDTTEVNTSNLEYSGLKVNFTTGMVTKSYTVPFTVDQLTADGFEIEFKDGGSAAQAQSGSDAGQASGQTGTDAAQSADGSQAAASGTDRIEKAFIKSMNIPTFEVLSGTREILDIYDVDTVKSQSKEPVLVSLSMNGASIGCGSSYDDLVAVFGEPDEIYRDDQQIYLCKYYSDCKVSDQVLEKARENKVVEHQLDFNHSTGNITSLTVYFYAGSEIINDFDLRLGYYDTATGTSYRFY